MDEKSLEQEQLLHELQVHQVELKMQNEELRETQSRLSSAWEEYYDLYEHAPVGYCTLSSSGEFVKANQTLATLLGVETSTLLGKKLAEFALAEDQDRVFLFLRNLKKRQESASILVSMRKGAAGSFWSRIDAHRVDVSGNSVIRVVLNDVSSEKAAEQALEMSARLEALGALAGGIAHDFNNLLGGILGYLTLARGMPDASPTVLRYLDKAVAVFDRARSLTHQLLTFTKQESPRTKVVDLRHLVERSAAFTLSGSESRFEMTCTDNLWPVVANESQCAQVVDNLVLNASQAMAGRGCVRIALENVTRGANDVPGLAAGYYCDFVVTDTGPGVPLALQHKIFDPFFTTKTSGHGLGLASSRSIVTKHGGALWVDSVEGSGASFVVALPALPGAVFGTAEAVALDFKGSGSILIMDDEVFNLEILSDLLGSVGYETLEARDGEEALRLCRENPSLEAAFLDLTIKGGLGGNDIVGPLLAAHPLLPVFAISGYSVDPIISHPSRYGFTDSLEKPFRRCELMGLLAKHLANAQA